MTSLHRPAPSGALSSGPSALSQPARRSAGRAADVLLVLVLAALLAGAHMSALAQSAAAPARPDREQPMLIEADALVHDEAQRLSVFSGNVVISQGALLLRGQRAELRQDAQGNQSGVLQGAPGQRAFFRQQRALTDETLTGEALRIEYDGRSGNLRLLEQAVLRRYLGNALSEQTQGHLIVYNRHSERFSVEGSAAARTPDNPLGRVRALITPRPAAPATTPAAPAAAPAPALQASPQLEPRR